MTDGVARIAQADHLVDRLPVAHPDVGQPGRQVGARLPAESVLRRDQDVGLVPGLPERLPSDRAMTM